MDKQALDRHITGNWGEDSVSPDSDEIDMDKGEILDFLINRRFVTEEEARTLSALSIEEIRGIYDGYAIPPEEDEPAAHPGGSGDESQDFDDFIERASNDLLGSPGEDDDPQCVCGVYRSEHALCGCPEGFQSPASWQAERDTIYERAWRDDDRYDGEYDEP